MKLLYFVTGSDSRLAEIQKLLGDVVFERVDGGANLSEPNDLEGRIPRA